MDSRVAEIQLTASRNTTLRGCNIYATAECYSTLQDSCFFDLNDAGRSEHFRDYIGRAHHPAIKSSTIELRASLNHGRTQGCIICLRKNLPFENNRAEIYR